MSDEETNCYLVEPVCHGNGGWIGEDVLKEGSLEHLLSFRPSDFGWEPIYDSIGRMDILNELRICKTSDVNDALYIYDYVNKLWTKA